jgi:hypothetical protein
MEIIRKRWGRGNALSIFLMSALILSLFALSSGGFSSTHAYHRKRLRLSVLRVDLIAFRDEGRNDLFLSIAGCIME